MGKRVEGENYSQHSFNAFILEHYCVLFKGFGSPSSCASFGWWWKKTLMGYIYETMNSGKDTIVRSFNGNEEKYKKIFNIIDKRWEIELHRPLHAVGYFLNPKFFYDKLEIEHDAEIMSDLYKCILRLTRDPTSKKKLWPKWVFTQMPKDYLRMS